MALQSGPLAGLFHRTRSSVTQAFPTPNLSGKVISNEGPSIRARHSTQSVRNTDKLGCANIKRRGHSSNCLSRRFPDRTPGLTDSQSPYPRCAPTSLIFGMANKSRKIYYDSMHKSSLFGRCSDVADVETQGCKTKAQHLYCSCRLTGRTNMVAFQLPPTFPVSSPATISFPDYRRIGHTKGRSARQSSTVGPVDRRRKAPSLQSRRHARNPQDGRSRQSSFMQVYCPSSVRQQNCGDMLAQRRKDQSAGIRSVRIRTGESRGELRLTGSERFSGNVLRCSLPSLELSPSLGLSTVLPDSQSIAAPKLSVRRAPISSSKVEENILETGCKSSGKDVRVHQEASSVLDRHSNRSTAARNTHEDHVSREMWGWSDNLSDWSEAQLQLLKASWRPSTIKTYRVAWNRWLKWTGVQKLNPFEPNGSILSRYLADLHIVDGLAYNTILLHKSVVSTLCNFDNAEKLSSHILVRHILKAIALTKPVPRKSTIWDIDKLILYLNNYYVDENSIFATLRHTATLLLLCSGRRVHDLTLLAIDSKHLIVHNDYLIFWPLFGSKTDTATYRQSGWRLSTNTANKNLNPVFWVKHAISLTRDRRQPECQNLFISTKGQPKAASRTIIAGWVKSLLLEAGVIDSPGSIRSAVASKNWCQSCPLDELLSKGNWRSHNTFARFYCKEVIPSTDTNRVTSMFNSV